ncbi:MAG: hybrid sensor histidine kinase/response regulator [Polyangia bacterium]
MKDSKSGQPTLPTLPTPVARPQVLLVDDVTANLVAMEAQLASLDCELVRASSGNQALKELLKKNFAVMLLDVQMPGMDGYEVASYARNNPKTRDVPIVFVTAMDESDEHVLRGYDTGAFDFLFKPVNPHVLRSKVQVFLDLFRGRQSLNNEIAAHRQTLVELEQLSKFKSQFLANMSHELRTPLNAIIGFSEMLCDDQRPGALSPQQKEHIGYVLESGKHLLSLINDVLDLSRIEAGRIELNLQSVAPGPFLDSMREIGRTLAMKQGVDLQVAHAPDLPEVQLDPLRFKQVLYNLLSNAIKFTPRGGCVRVRAQCTVDALSVEVEDTGVGIRTEDLPRLFREFERIEWSAGGPKPEGTGLGLALTKRLVELHGGTVVVKSVPQRGSTFTVTVPRHPPGETTSADKS